MMTMICMVTEMFDHWWKIYR